MAQTDSYQQVAQKYKFSTNEAPLYHTTDIQICYHHQSLTVKIVTFVVHLSCPKQKDGSLKAKIL